MKKETEKTLTVSLENYKSLNKVYQKAVKDGLKGDDVIIWEGKELLVAYLFYLLTYFEMEKEIGDYAIKRRITRKRV